MSTRSRWLALAAGAVVVVLVLLLVVVRLVGDAGGGSGDGGPTTSSGGSTSASSRSTTSSAVELPKAARTVEGDLSGARVRLEVQPLVRSGGVTVLTAVITVVKAPERGPLNITSDFTARGDGSHGTDRPTSASSSPTEASWPARASRRTGSRPAAPRAGWH